MQYRNKFSERLIELRKNHSLLQKDIATYLGVTIQAYSLLEKANRSPSFEVLMDLADYFNVSIDYLVGRIDTPYSEEYIYKTEEDFFVYCEICDENESGELNMLKYSLFDNLPPHYKDPILRKQNYSLEIRVKILSKLKTLLYFFKITENLREIESDRIDYLQKKIEQIFNIGGD